MIVLMALLVSLLFLLVSGLPAAGVLVPGVAVDLFPLVSVLSGGLFVIWAVELFVVGRRRSLVAVLGSGVVAGGLVYGVGLFSGEVLGGTDTAWVGYLSYGVVSLVFTVGTLIAFVRPRHDEPSRLSRSIGWGLVVLLTAVSLVVVMPRLLVSRADADLVAWTEGVESMEEGERADHIVGLWEDGALCPVALTWYGLAALSPVYSASATAKLGVVHRIVAHSALASGDYSTASKLFALCAEELPTVADYPSLPSPASLCRAMGTKLDEAVALGFPALPVVVEELVYDADSVFVITKEGIHQGTRPLVALGVASPGSGPSLVVEAGGITYHQGDPVPLLEQAVAAYKEAATKRHGGIPHATIIADPSLPSWVPSLLMGLLDSVGVEIVLKAPGTYPFMGSSDLPWKIGVAAAPSDKTKAVVVTLDETGYRVTPRPDGAVENETSLPKVPCDEDGKGSCYPLHQLYSLLTAMKHTDPSLELVTVVAGPRQPWGDCLETLLAVRFEMEQDEYASLESFRSGAPKKAHDSSLFVSHVPLFGWSDLVITP